jgi:hypothetical protein
MGIESTLTEGIYISKGEGGLLQLAVSVVGENRLLHCVNYTQAFAYGWENMKEKL